MTLQPHWLGKFMAAALGLWAVPLAAFYFEGSFRSGVPDGVLRVEEPGQKTRARTFRAGKDAGGASPKDVTQLVF
jgi:hypothetical protein